MSVFFIYNKNVQSINPSYVQGDIERLGVTQIGKKTVLRAHSLKAKHGNEVLVSSIMKTGVEVLNQDNNLLDAKNLFDEKGFNHVPIMDGGRVVGILSSNDLKNIHEFNSILIRDHIGELTLAISKETPIKVVMQIFLNENIHCLPIIDQNASLEGIVTQNDILKWILENKRYKK